MSVFRLGLDPIFPDPCQADPDGLLAVGGDLCPERLLAAYAAGIFPWYGPDQPILCWSPDPRGVIELDAFHTGRTLRRVLKRRLFEVRINTAFEETIRCCARSRKGNAGDRWLTDEMIDAYIRLYRLGHAHSVEAWRDNELAGGLYGVTVGGLFAGESMFHRRPNASRVALAALVDRLRQRGYRLLDCQMVTPATAGAGAREISRSIYLERLAEALRHDCRFDENRPMERTEPESDHR